MLRYVPTGMELCAVITQVELARRLRFSRLNVGLSQEAVAAELGVPRPTISQIESGKRGVGSLELAKLAELYHYPLTAFFAEDFQQALSDDPLAPLFRLAEFQPLDRAVVAEFVDRCRAYTDLEAILERGGTTLLPDYSSIGEPQNRLEAVRQGERVAAEERRRLGSGDDPMRNVLVLLDAQGIRAFVRPLRTGGISGLFLCHPSTGPSILVNGADPNDGLAACTAHQYAHLLLDRRLEARVCAAGSLRRDSEKRDELLEVRAGSFAAAFLLPPAGAERFLRDRGRVRRRRHALDLLDVFCLHRAFGLGFDATIWRLESLGWLDAGRRAEFTRYRPERLAKALGLPEQQAEDIVGRYPLHYLSLAMEAYRRGEISLGKLSELLGQDLMEARELVWDLGLEPEAALVPRAG